MSCSQVQMTSPSLFPSPDPYRRRRCAKLYNMENIKMFQTTNQHKVTNLRPFGDYSWICSTYPLVIIANYLIISINNPLIIPKIFQLIIHKYQLLIHLWPTIVDPISPFAHRWDPNLFAAPDGDPRDLIVWAITRSGNDEQFAIENGHRNSEFSH